MERDESIDVRIEISAGWKVVKGFCDELHRKKKVSANICKSIGSDWVRVRLSEEGYHTSFNGPALHSLSQLLLTACTHMNMLYMRKVKNLFENYPYAPLHRWHSCTPAAEAEADSTGLMTWNLHWSSLNTEHETQNTYTTRCRLFCLHFDCARVAVAVAVAADVDVDVYVSRCREGNIDAGVPHKGALTKAPRIRWHMAGRKLRANHGLKNGIYQALASPLA